MPFRLADPAARHPMTLPDGSVNRCMVHLNRVIRQENVEIGDWTYANDFDPPQDWRARLAPYLYPGAPERLTIGRFCQIAHGARFITASANHLMRGATTYPFGVFDHAAMGDFMAAFESLPDTVIGNDVWIGHGALILPGARIGHGAIVGAGAVVGGAAPDYAVVAGNPGRVVRMRFDPATVARLLELRWWDWPPERISEHAGALMLDDPARTAGEVAPTRRRGLDSPTRLK